MKAVLQPERTADGVIRVGTSQYGVAADVRDTGDGLAWQLMGLMDGTRDVPTIVLSIVDSNPGVTAAAVELVMSELIEAGFVEDAGAPPPPSLCAEELERYRYNAEFFAWVDTEPRQSRWDAQARLKHARVTIVGLGGTGCAVAMSLVAAGVGTLRVVDGDAVELSNLNRQLLYTARDVGRDKTTVAAAQLRQINPNVNVHCVHRQVHSLDDALSLLEGEDLLVLSADTPPGEIQRWVNDAALQSGTPWLLCGYAGPMIVLGLFVPGEGACYRCFDHQQRLEERAVERLAPIDKNAIRAVIAPSANLSGHLAALEAIYFLGGLGSRTKGRIFHQNLVRFEHSYYVDSPQWSDCPACGSRPTRAEAPDASEVATLD